ncbi:MAG: Teichoic acids export ATP-binding protein TagH [Gammaproteobacteria bacterium]|nr:Teichoic acids export ATP-binding protein TagH [Gammaproteobacteria bacterium]
MYVRLAFSVVINMQPDILIIDEALAVGDAGFQRKCFRKLDELKYNNVTILFVTHATDAIVAHCDRAVFLEKGGVKEIGKPKTVVNNYLESLFNGRYKTSKEAARAKEKFVVSKELNTDSRVDGCPYRASYNATEYRWGNGEGRIIDYTVLNKERGEIGAICKAGSDVTIAASVYFPGAQQNLVYGLTIKTVDGITVFGSNSMKIGFQAGIAEAGEVIRVEFGVGLQLISGEYFFSIGVVSVEKGSEDIILDRRYDLFRLHIEDDATAFGYAALPFSVNTKGKPAGARC